MHFWIEIYCSQMYSDWAVFVNFYIVLVGKVMRLLLQPLQIRRFRLLGHILTCLAAAQIEADGAAAASGRYLVTQIRSLSVDFSLLICGAQPSHLLLIIYSRYWGGADAAAAATWTAWAAALARVARDWVRSLRMSFSRKRLIYFLEIVIVLLRYEKATTHGPVGIFFLQS